MNLLKIKLYLKQQIKNIIQNDYLNNIDIREYQVKKINEVIENAKNNSKFYKTFYKDVDLELKTLSDIKKLPILKKEIFKKAIQENSILSKNFDKNELSCGHTTGSTGTPLEMCFDKKCSKLRSQVQNRLWKNMRILPYKRFVKIWRDKTLNATEQKLKDAGLLLPIAVGDVSDPLNSAVTNEKIQNIIKELIEFKPQIIRGYVSSLYSIAQVVEKQNIKFSTLEAITTSAEYLPCGIWEYFEKVFACPVYNLYGGTEAPSIAVNKKDTHNLEISEDLYYVEVLDENGNDVKAGEQGLITITDLHSYATPLIRYQIGDMAIIDENFYKLGTEFRYFKSVEGRTNDIFELEDGSLIYSHLWFVYFRTENWIEKFKVVQETKKDINVKLLVSENYNHDSLIKLQNKINEIYPNLDFKWELVDKFDLDNGNKFRSVLSLIDNKFNKINKG